MRKPNSYGSVYKLPGNRRKPYTAVVTKDFELVNGKAVQKRSYLGYYATQKEAEIALANYNQNPYDTELTFEEVYAKWIVTKKLSDGTLLNYKTAYKKFAPIYKTKFSSLKTSDLEAVFNKCNSTAVRQRMKAILNQMYKYALKYDIVQTNFAERFAIPNMEPKIKRVPFTDEEIQKLWEMDDDYAKATLILIYTGMRASELKVVEVDYDNWTLKGGLKTEAGRDRIIPIREKIKPLFPIPESIARVSRTYYYSKELKFLQAMNHTTHDCRVTFITRYKNQDPTALKLIVGHKIDDITKSVYTKYSLEELRKFIESEDF